MFLNKSILILGLIIFLSFACEKSNSSIVQSNVFFEVVDGDKSFASKMGSYEPAFIRTHGFHQFVYRKSGGMNSQFKTCGLSGYTEDNIDSDSRLDAFFVNEYSARSFLSLDPEEQVSIMEENFGKEVTFRFIEEGEKIYEESLYFPDAITLDTELSGVDLIEGSNIGKYKLGTPLYINSDPDNSNGLLLSLSYRGNRLTTTLDDIQNGGNGAVNILRHLYVPIDSGIIEFPEGFWAGIPDGGIFYLQIERTSYKLFSLGEKTHKLSAKTEYSFDLALSR